MAKQDKLPRRGTVVRACTCSHEFQDKLYGKGRRVANVTANGKSRCTVCGREH